MVAGADVGVPTSVSSVLRRVRFIVLKDIGELCSVTYLSSIKNRCEEPSCTEQSSSDPDNEDKLQSENGRMLTFLYAEVAVQTLIMSITHLRKQQSHERERCAMNRDHSCFLSNSG